MNRLPRPLFAVLCLALIWQAPAAAETAGVFATDSDAPINIEADKMSLFRSGAQAELLGNAALAQGPLSLTAREVAVFYGTTAPRRLTRITAAEDVHIISKNGREVFGDAAVYLVSAEEMTVTGNVRVINTKDTDADTLTGVRLIINLRNGTSRIFGTLKGTKNNDKGDRRNGGRARIQLKPGAAR
ncbi:MAG: LptA/OstA family protein [Pseudomonadota bacterium]|nr:LptA/OstA family protein [Pseudomonadota bacterium]